VSLYLPRVGLSFVSFSCHCVSFFSVSGDKASSSLVFPQTLNKRKPMTWEVFWQLQRNKYKSMRVKNHRRKQSHKESLHDTFIAGERSESTFPFSLISFSQSFRMSFQFEERIRFVSHSRLTLIVCHLCWLNGKIFLPRKEGMSVEMKSIRVYDALFCYLCYALVMMIGHHQVHPSQRTPCSCTFVCLFRVFSVCRRFSRLTVELFYSFTVSLNCCMCTLLVFFLPWHQVQSSYSFQERRVLIEQLGSLGAAHVAAAFLTLLHSSEGTVSVFYRLRDNRRIWSE
jgi:hypothetical protein